MTTRISYLISILALLFVLGQSCKSPKGQAMKDFVPYSPNESTLFLSLTAHLDSLGSMLDRQLDSVLAAEGGSFSDGQMEVSVKKLGPLKLNAGGDSLQYRLPLDLDIAYDAGVASLKANGQVELDFSTFYQIDSSWNLQTQTTLREYKWLKQPKLKVGFISLPASMLVDWVIGFGKNEVSRLIDQQIQENLPLHEWVEDTWNIIKEPLLLEEEMKAWLVTNPNSLAMSPVVSEDGLLKMNLRATCSPFIRVGEKPDSLTEADLPSLDQFDPEEQSQKFSLFVRAAMLYQEAEGLARENLVGQEFDVGKKTIKVEDLRLYGEENQVVVDMDVSGDYKGKLAISGRPEYEPRGNRIKLKDMDFTVDTKSFLLKSASWMLKGVIVNKMEKELNLYMDSYKADWRELLAKELDNMILPDGLRLEASVDDLKVENTFLAQDAIVVDMGLFGMLGLYVEGF